VSDEIEDDNDTLMKLANFRAARRHERRQLEWRFSIAVWAALGGLIFKGFSLPCWPLPAIVSIFVVIVLIHAWWIGLNWVRNERDIRKAFFYADRLHARVIGVNPPTEPRFVEVVKAKLRGHPVPEKSCEWPQVRGCQMFEFLLDPMYVLEVTVTVGLAAAAYLVVGQQHCALTVAPHLT
jgi:hypothetical protein